MQLIWRSGAALASCVARVVFANVIEPQRVLAPRGTTRSARKVVKDWTTKFFYQRLHSICAPATVKSMKTDIIKSDFEVLLSSTATHPSAKYIATVAETTSWCRLRDLALDCGVQGTSSTPASGTVVQCPHYTHPPLLERWRCDCWWSRLYWLAVYRER